MNEFVLTKNRTIECNAESDFKLPAFAFGIGSELMWGGVKQLSSSLDVVKVKEV